MKEFLVTAECVDVRNGQRYQPGSKFPADAPQKQVQRLISAGCIDEVDLSSSPVLASAVAAAGAVNEIDAAVKEKKAEAGRLAHGGSAIDEVLRSGTEPTALTARSDADTREAGEKAAAEAKARADADARAAEEKAAAEAKARADADARAAEEKAADTAMRTEAGEAAARAKDAKAATAKR